ncbi:MAG: glycosyltransferase family 2 protein [Deltaproteobacteria bacterium]|nr:glycosyltransferase family 2 protein [Deltaproteobacteria bacterium]
MPERDTLSVTIITLNEQDNIRACLESVAWADEVVVVDSFSTDETVAICREYTDRVIQRKWPGFLKQKQFAHEQAGGDWILNLDADERLSPEAAEEIQAKVLQGACGADGFSFPRKSFYLNRWIRHGGWFPDYKLRLVRRSRGRWSGGNLHEKLVADGEAVCLNGPILHYVYRDIAHQLTTIDSFSKVAARELYLKGKRFHLALLLCRPLIRFLEMYVWKRGVLDGMAGLVIAVLSSYYVFLKYAKLWEMQKLKGAGPLPEGQRSEQP